jgi:hypothetical protein
MYKVDVIEDSVEYMLEEDTEPLLLLDDEEDGGTLTFYDEYRKERDEDGYHPPKYLALDGVLDSIVVDVLKDMGRDDLGLGELDTTEDFTMETCYVLPERMEKIRKAALREHKMTCYTVTVERKRRLPVEGGEATPTPKKCKHQ